MPAPPQTDAVSDAGASAAARPAVAMWLGFALSMSMLADGLYNPRQWVPAAFALVLLAGWASWSSRAMPTTGAARALLASLVLIAVLSAASIGWAWFSPHLAWEEAGRSAMYVAAAYVGMAVVAGRRALAAFSAAFAAATASACLVVLVWVASSGDATTPFAFGALIWPVGYSNALSALASMACFLSLGRVHRAVSFRQRSAAAAWGAGAACCAAIVLLSASQGTVTSMVVGTAVAVYLIPRPARFLMTAACVLVPLLLLELLVGNPEPILQQLPAAVGKAQVSEALVDSAASHARDYAVGALVAVLAAAAAVTLFGRWAPGPPLDRGARAAVGAPNPRRRRIAVGAAVLVVAGTVIGLALPQSRQLAADGLGGCVRRASEADARRAAVDMPQSDNNRCDYWSVAYEAMLDRPVGGWGAGSYEGRYVALRQSAEGPRQAHSLLFEKASELGVAGVALVLVMFGAALASFLRVRRGGDDHRSVAGPACAAVAFWCVYTMFEFFWNLPAVTLPVIVLLGALSVGTELPRPRARGVRRARAIVVASCLVAVLGLAPLAIADVLTARAAGAHEEEASARRAVGDARRAAWIAPLWAEPLRASMVLHLRLGDMPKAAAAAREAVRREPNNWSIRAAAAEVLHVTGDLRGARRELAAARSLNPQLRTELPARESTPARAAPDPA